jgi:cytochrome c2
MLCGVAVLVACGASADGEPVVDVPDGNVALGKSALKNYACVTCHTIPGVNGLDTHVGPPLNSWAERNFIAGTLPNEPDNLILWIMDPQSVRPGTAMPDLNVSEADARNMTAYLFTLEDD